APYRLLPLCILLSAARLLQRSHDGHRRNFLPFSQLRRRAVTAETLRRPILPGHEGASLPPSQLHRPCCQGASALADRSGEQGRTDTNELELVRFTADRSDQPNELAARSPRR